MSSKAKSPEDWISFLLTVIDNVPAKPDWNKIASDTGAYKSGKFAAQAYSNLRKKYDSLASNKDGANVPPTPGTPGSGKKRAKPADLNEDDDEKVEEKPKRSRKPKTPKKENPKKEIDDDDDDDDEDVKMEKVKDEESDDVLNGDTTIGGEGDQD